MSQEASFRDLIRRVRAGDDRAAEELVRQYEPEIRRAVRVRLTDPDLRRIVDSLDICQSVLGSFFARAALGQYQLDEPKHLLRLLITMARNKVADLARRETAQRRDRRREQPLDGAADTLEDPRPTPRATIAAKDLLEPFHSIALLGVAPLARTACSSSCLRVLPSFVLHRGLVVEGRVLCPMIIFLWAYKPRNGPSASTSDWTRNTASIPAWLPPRTSWARNLALFWLCQCSRSA